MKQGLSLRVSQHLALTPQLQQSIRLLQLSTLELGQEIQQMLDDNPFLEVQAEDLPEEFGPAAADARAPEGSVDMGTGYDCSDPRAHTSALSITAVQRRWRNLLVSVMGRQGFVNYSKEWWHFSLPGAGGAAYDFPITARHN